MVVETLRRRRYTAYFAGGYVRDRLLDVAVKDFDMATDARPDDRRDALGLDHGPLASRRRVWRP